MHKGEKGLETGKSGEQSPRECHPVDVRQHHQQNDALIQDLLN